jgi:DNA-binding MurR/RpiR family transcriptional regulator
MLYDIDHILQRARDIRLSPPELARKAGKPVSTVARFARRKSGNTDTLAELQKALVDEELRLLDHLRQLHDEEAA